MPQYQEKEVRGKSLGYLLAVSLTALSVVPNMHPLEARDGRDFAGSYELRDVVDQGEQVNGRFVARVFNYSDRDISGATVLLDGSLVPGDRYATWPGLNLFDRESVRVDAWVTISKREYEQWQKGLTPMLQVEFHDPAGSTFRSRVELLRDQMGDGN